MKKHITFVLIAIICFLAVSAHAADKKESKIEKQLSELQSALQLTEDQTTHIRNLFTAREEQVKEIREQSSDDATQKESIKKIRKATDEKILKLLTEEQKGKYKEYKKRRREQRGNKKRGQRGNNKKPRE